MGSLLCSLSPFQDWISASLQTSCLESGWFRFCLFHISPRGRDRHHVRDFELRPGFPPAPPARVHGVLDCHDLPGTFSLNICPPRFRAASFSFYPPPALQIPQRLPLTSANSRSASATKDASTAKGSSTSEAQPTRSTAARRKCSRASSRSPIPPNRGSQSGSGWTAT